MKAIRLIDAFRYTEAPKSAFVGAGGKTTAIFCAARELISQRSDRSSKNIVIVTTTTHFGVWQAGLADWAIQVHSSRELEDQLDSYKKGILLITGGEINQRLISPSPELLEIILGFVNQNKCPLLIEADGSGNRPIKAPDEHEPAIPEFIESVIVVAGLSALGKPLNSEWVHRPDIFSKLSGIKYEEMIGNDGLVNVLLHKNGGLKNIQPSMRRILFLNQADTPELRAKGSAIADQLINIYQGIIIGSLRKVVNQNKYEIKEDKSQCAEISAVKENVAGIILAAGGASRFGEPKQILRWKGQTFIRHIVLTAISAGLSPVIVVLGASGEEIAKHISDLPVQIVDNQYWKDGLSSSIRAGVASLPNGLGGALFLHADQPGITVPFLRHIVEAHHQTFQPIIAPIIDGKRGNPVLFDVNLFGELISLKGDVGGRSLFSDYTVEWVPWHDPKAAVDIDTQEDYQRLVKDSEEG